MRDHLFFVSFYLIYSFLILCFIWSHISISEKHRRSINCLWQHVSNCICKRVQLLAKAMQAAAVSASQWGLLSLASSPDRNRRIINEAVIFWCANEGVELAMAPGPCFTSTYFNFGCARAGGAMSDHKDLNNLDWEQRTSSRVTISPKPFLSTSSVRQLQWNF